jgi:hypothetical protein
VWEIDREEKEKQRKKKIVHSHTLRIPNEEGSEEDLFYFFFNDTLSLII